MCWVFKRGILNNTCQGKILAERGILDNGVSVKYGYVSGGILEDGVSLSGNRDMCQGDILDEGVSGE